MQAIHTVYAVCCGVDVHKKEVTACLVWRDAEGRRQSDVRTYRTMTQELLSLREWLDTHGCPVVAMESTGVYWKPLFNLLEGDFEVLLVNPAHVKNVPGRKTDVKDSEWLAELLEHGLLKASFIPPVAIRDLRDLTRYRRKLVEMKSSEVNRLAKVLEDANIKLASVATDVMGVSCREMIAALIAGERDVERLSELARGRLRSKREELALALEGIFRPHHAELLGMILEHIDSLEAQIAQLESKVDALCVPYESQIQLLDTTPGVSRRSAQDMIAEIGIDMEPFPSHKHLCSWSGMSPGNHESAGKRQSGKTTKGNKWLRAILVESAHAAAHTKDTYLGAKYHRLAARKGKKRAAVAVGHAMLEGAYFILRDGVAWNELGPDYLDTRNTQRQINHHLKRLAELGVTVQLPEQKNQEPNDQEQASANAA